MFSYNDKFNYFEDDTLAKDWFNEMCRRISWKMFERQEEWIYMAGELGIGRKPMIKEEYFDVMADVFNEQIALLKHVIFEDFFRLYMEDDIDVSKEAAEKFNWYFGYEPEDEEWYIEGKDK